MILGACLHIVKSLLPNYMGILTLKGRRVSIYIHIHNLYGLHQVHKSFFNVLMCLKPYYLYTFACQGENKNILVSG